MQLKNSISWCNFLWNSINIPSFQFHVYLLSLSSSNSLRFYLISFWLSFIFLFLYTNTNGLGQVHTNTIIKYGCLSVFNWAISLLKSNRTYSQNQYQWALLLARSSCRNRWSSVSFMLSLPLRANILFCAWPHMIFTCSWWSGAEGCRCLIGSYTPCCLSKNSCFWVNETENPSQNNFVTCWFL